MAERTDVDELVADLSVSLAHGDKLCDTTATIDPPTRVEQGQQVGDLLACLGVRMDSLLDGRLVLGQQLGEGGMGLLLSAWQVALGRKVAVKTLKAGSPTEDSSASLRLLQEAWTTGTLGHPNIVPVHSIEFDTEQRPLVVLHQIRGEQWRSYIADPRRVRERFGEDDLLEWNLGVLMQVCNAVAFAHDQGIVHRDIKPANVMIGEYGEVYLVDWGIAVSLFDRENIRLPLAAESVETAGTLRYMAPEMLGGIDTPISTRTDIYLLGAVLYQILTGRPPHHGDSAEKIVRSIVTSNPELPSDCPAELSSICRRALARDPEVRFESAQELRQAIRTFLHHRGSTRLTAEAEERARRLARALDDRNAAAPDGRTHRLYSECVFGFNQALSQWPGNERARKGLRDTVRLMAESALARDDPRSASKFLADIDDPPGDLAGAVGAALAAQEERQRQEKIYASAGREMDLRIGHRFRARVAVILGGIWTLTFLLFAFLVQDTPRETYGVLAGAGLLTVVLAAIPIAVMWRQLRRTAVDRRIAAATFFAMISCFVLLLGCHWLEVDVKVLVVFSMLVWFAQSGVYSILVEPWFAPSTLGFAVAFVVAAAAPGLRYHALACSILAMTVNLVLIWGRPPPAAGDDPA